MRDSFIINLCHSLDDIPSEEITLFRTISILFATRMTAFWEQSSWRIWYKVSTAISNVERSLTEKTTKYASTSLSITSSCEQWQYWQFGSAILAQCKFIAICLSLYFKMELTSWNGQFLLGSIMEHPELKGELYCGVYL